MEEELMYCDICGYQMEYLDTCDWCGRTYCEYCGIQGISCCNECNDEIE